MRRLGVIGGSGLYEMDGLENVREEKVRTPFGEPSDNYRIGRYEGSEIAFLPRHGKGHRILPGELNFRANIYGFKALGFDRIIGVNAVGSLREKIKPLDIVVPDQFFDRTNQGRKNTFFGEGIVAHISFTEPVCPQLVDVLCKVASDTGAVIHRGGTYLNMEGPAFSTKAESGVYRQWGMDIIGMTALLEAKLSREAEICYAVMAMVTDYDCWREGKSVTIEEVLGNLNKNAALAKKIIKTVSLQIPKQRECPCAKALENAVITSDIAPELLEKLDLIVGKYNKGTR